MFVYACIWALRPLNEGLAQVSGGFRGRFDYSLQPSSVCWLRLGPKWRDLWNKRPVSP